MQSRIRRSEALRRNYAFKRKHIACFRVFERNYSNRKVDSESLQKDLAQLPVNWAKLSEKLTGNPFTIRAKGRDKIPKKYHAALSELVEVLQKWVDTHCT